jgi:hypothetical protein
MEITNDRIFCNSTDNAISITNLEKYWFLCYLFLSLYVCIHCNLDFASVKIFFYVFKGFVIPVNIRVTDANDNTPQFVNAPYVLNISEVRRKEKDSLHFNVMRVFYFNANVKCFFKC